mmetsp:Transcript_15804/g.47443  ORF Transcript_15804/g.47443 Transcript_15804/m.47443 type:complete len:534 (-) Transcript_15804:77-1678(-)|eukprot:CAMPEP_0177655102 /NCGR_PEP_ID=MMETSP0447-20121125/14752_1 /TAXON_ID=0 /ORGANISM="Stygamoeba regulata, Strain BSH-02190019" /LENGTH=533 /DNA_ID=CAMNT_0019158927 /DNA_START=137 /DNA_END=1738 /DNA_ORIENTATION=+
MASKRLSVHLNKGVLSKGERPMSTIRGKPAGSSSANISAVAAADKADSPDNRQKRRSVVADAASMVVSKSGFMKRQAGSQRIWQKLFFVQRGHLLQCFKTNRYESEKAIATINVGGLRVNPIDEKTAQLKHVFQIYHPARLDQTWFLCAPSKKDYEEWIEVIKKASVVRKAMRKLHAETKQDKTKQERLAKLRERMAANEAAIATQKNTQELEEDILGTIRFIVEFIAITSSGITVKNVGVNDEASMSRAEQIFASLRRGQQPDFTDETLPTAFQFLRVYLSHLKYPLLTFGQHDEFLNSYKKYLALDRVKRFKQLIDILPKNNREALHRVLELLCLIDYNSKFNGSNINQIVEGFTSSILRAQTREKESRDLAKKVVRFLIKRTKLIFEDTQDEDFEDPDLDKAQQFFTLRSELRFSTTPILLPTGAVALTHKSGDVVIDKATDREITHELDVFSRDIGNQGLLFLLDREIDDINGRLSRLTDAKTEISKWDDLSEEITQLENDVRSMNKLCGEMKTKVDGALNDAQKKLKL